MAYLREYYCEQCKKKSPDFEWEDVGVGVTDAWGQRNIDICYVAITNCCGASTVGKDGGHGQPESEDEYEIN